jgi:hypothetical protein
MGIGIAHGLIILRRIAGMYEGYILRKGTGGQSVMWVRIRAENGRARGGWK